MTGRHRKQRHRPPPRRPVALWPHLVGVLLTAVITWHLSTQAVTWTDPPTPAPANKERP